MKYLLLVLLVLLAGCVSGRVDVDQAGICSFQYSSFLKEVQSPNLDLCGATLTAAKSTAKDEVVQALINAL